MALDQRRSLGLLLKLLHPDVFFFCWPVRHAEILQKPGRPLPLPTYLPTYLPYLWETKKEITGWVKVR